ncbi:MAG: hypothetical protein ACLQSR_00265 [Limisphaerales bacterium]
MGLLSLGAAFPLCLAKGQEALLSETSLENAIAAQSNPTFVPPDRPHLGPVQLTLGAYAGVAYDDNVNESQTDVESDVISRGGVNLGFNWPATDHSQLQFGTSVGYLHYLKETANNGLEITPDSALTYALSVDDVIFTFYDQFSYSRQVKTEPALANVATLPQFANTIGAQAEWDPGKWTFQASYGRSINFSDSSNDYLNSSSDNFFGQAGWRFAESTQAGIQASASQTSYQVSSQGNTASYSVGGYLQWQILSSLHLTLSGGPAISTFSSPSTAGGNSTLNSYYVSLAVSQQLTDFISQSLQINHSVQPGINQGSGYVEQFTTGYSANWQLTRRINVGVSGSYVDGQQPFVEGYLFGIFPIETIEQYQEYSGGLQASWQFTDHLEGSLSYTHSLRNSNLADRDYSDNNVSFQLNYAF